MCNFNNQKLETFQFQNIEIEPQNPPTIPENQEDLEATLLYDSLASIQLIRIFIRILSEFQYINDEQTIAEVISRLNDIYNDILRDVKEHVRGFCTKDLVMRRNNDRRDDGSNPPAGGAGGFGIAV